jgi:hypothetical protein
MSPMNVSNKAAKGTTYADIRIGECQVHQISIPNPDLFPVDMNNAIPVGLPVKADGSPIIAPGGVAFGLIGPESVPAMNATSGGAHAQFANCFISGTFNLDMIEDNLGRALTADEKSAIGAAGSLLKLI